MTLAAAIVGILLLGAGVAVFILMPGPAGGVMLGLGVALLGVAGARALVASRGATPPPVVPGVPEEAADRLKLLPDIGRTQADLLGHKIGVKLALDEDGIRALEKLIRQDTESDPQRRVDAYGAFLGEAIRALHGGEWAWTEQAEYHLVGVNGRHKVYPFAYVSKRLGGEGNKVSIWYEALQQRLGA